MKRTASDETRGPGAFGSAGAGASIANATRRSSIFAAPPCASASAPPKYVRILAASCSASAPVGFASSAAWSNFAVNAVPSCARAAPAPAMRTIAANHAIDVIVLIMFPSSARASCARPRYHRWTATSPLSRKRRSFVREVRIASRVSPRTARSFAGSPRTGLRMPSSRGRASTVSRRRARARPCGRRLR